MRITKSYYQLRNFENILLAALRSEYLEWDLPVHNCEAHFFGRTTILGEKIGVFRGMIEVTDDCFRGDEQIRRIINKVVETAGIPVTFEQYSDNRITMYWLDDAAVDMYDKYKTYTEEDIFRDI